MNRKRTSALVAALAAGLATVSAGAGDWPDWRGPRRNGVSTESGLVAEWSREGENLLWRVDLTGRSTPVVFDGRACATGRVGEEITRQEMVACFDAATGDRLWEFRFNVYHTTVPWNRVGWANPVGDPETGYLYVQGVGGLFFCLDRDGQVVWSRSLIEEFGFMEGYGGRTQTPIVDEDRVIVTFVNSGWGEQTAPRHRFFAFDKRSGELLWVAAPGGAVADKNTQSTPVVAEIGGQRLLIHGNADGWIYAIQARTGKKVWGFHLSKRGINTSVVVEGETIYAAHSEENIDQATMGRVVAIDATGSGDVTATHERWRAAVSAGFSSPTLAQGMLFVVDNSANLHALDVATGEERWTLDIGRVGKGSPVWADGRLYVTEVNGLFHIIAVNAESGRILDSERFEFGGGRYAEIYGSPAVAHGRVYFATEEGLYCLGDPEMEFAQAAAAEPKPAEEPVSASAAPATILVVPAEALIGVDAAVGFTVEAFDERGRSLGPRQADWSLDGLAGTIGEDGLFVPDPGRGSQAGRVAARVGELEATGRVRVIRDLPLEEDFNGIEPGERPSYLMGYASRFEVREIDGEKILFKGPSPVKIDRHITFLGRPDMSDYTVEADLLGTREGRTIPDLGLINSGYTLDLMGVHQRLEVRSWPSALRMARRVDFAWEPDVWYRMKFRVEVTGERALLYGKVWPREAAEPAEWTLTAEDPLPIREGNPGLYGYSPTPIYFDNVKVTRNR